MVAERDIGRLAASGRCNVYESCSTLSLASECGSDREAPIEAPGIRQCWPMSTLAQRTVREAPASTDEHEPDGADHFTTNSELGAAGRAESARTATATCKLLKPHSTTPYPAPVCKARSTTFLADCELTVKVGWCETSGFHVHASKAPMNFNLDGVQRPRH